MDVWTARFEGARAIEFSPPSPAPPRGRRVAVGVFDGVDQSDRAVIQGTELVVLLHRTRPEGGALRSDSARLELIAELGIERAVLVDPESCRIGLAGRLESLLADVLAARSVSTGSSLDSGEPAFFDDDQLRGRGIETTRVRPMVAGGTAVTPERIRDLVLAGEMSAADDLLGAPFRIDSIVVEGEKRGRELGFPTANQVPVAEIVTPPPGVYATLADGLPAVTSIGFRPTFVSRLGLLIETYVLDREIDLYGHHLQVDFLVRLRGEERFDSAEGLIRQMNLDAAEAAVICEQRVRGARSA